MLRNSNQGLDASIDALAQLNNPFHNKDFLLTWQYSDAALRSVLQGAMILEAMHRRNISLRCFHSGLAVSNFRDNSTRTRFSFASAANLLGLTQQDLDESKSQISHGETVRETATMISFLSEVVGIRDDMFIHEGHTYMQSVSDALEESYREGVLPQRPGVINLQCDLDHPTQSCADLIHLVNTYGGIENLRGKKVAMTWAYSPSYGKPLSVPQGIITLLPRFGMDVTLAHPEGYDLVPETLDIARDHATRSGGRFTTTDSMKAAFEGADIVYPKSWAPFKVMEERTELLRKGDKAGQVDLERRCLENNSRFKSWECNQDLMSLTRDGRALYMHCLPADITGVSCEQGEVSAEVFDRYRLDTYREAGHKPFVIASMILHTRFASPAGVLAQRLREGILRR